MNRVDFPVLAPLHVVGAKRSPEKLLVIAALVVVFDPEIAVSQQALRDDQVVWLVAPGAETARRHRAQDGEQRQAQPENAPPCRQTQPPLEVRDVANRSERSDGAVPRGVRGEHEDGDGPAKGPPEHQQKRPAVRQPGEKRQCPEPKQTERGGGTSDFSASPGARRRPDQRKHGCRASCQCQQRKLPDRGDERSPHRSLLRPGHDPHGRRQEPHGHGHGFEPGQHHGRTPPGPPIGRQGRRDHAGLRRTAM